MIAALNKTELAHHLKVSLPTLTRWLLRYGAEFPVLERGTNGASYRFDAGAVLEFLRTRQDEQAQAQAAQDEALAQLAFPADVLGEGAPRRGAREEIEAWKLRRIQREEAERAGRLVSAPAVLDGLRLVLGRLSRDMGVFVRQIGREQSWPDAYVRDVEKRLREQQRASVTALDALFGGLDRGDGSLRDAV